VSHQRIEFPRILARWQEVKDAAIAERGLLTNCCVLASKVLVVSFTEAGFDAWVEPTYAIAENREGVAWRSRPMSEWPPSAWSVGIEPGRIEFGSYPGHLIVMCKVDGELHLVDGAAGQFSRPAKQMTIPSVLAFPATVWPHGAQYNAGPWVLSYSQAHIGNLHRVGNDWTKNWRKYAQQMKEIPA
jgi:hypothetical protein